MKRFLILIGIILSTSSIFAVDVTLTGSNSGQPFSPSTATINLGDKITFIFNGFHNAASTSVPQGASTFRSGNVGSLTVWEYTPSVAGNYSYVCEPHPAMTGNFTVNAAPSISTGTLSNVTLCGNASVTIPYFSSGTFGSGNVFSVQLSDANGSFTASTNLNITNSTATDITATVPLNQASGQNYRVRVVASNPYTVGTTNSQNISINVSPTPDESISISPQGGICTGIAVTHTGTTVNLTNVSYAWFINGSATGTNNAKFIYANYANNDRGYVIVTGSTVGCNSMAYSNTIIGNLMTVSSSIVPSASILFRFGASSCFGATVVVDGTPNGGGVNPIYKMYVNNVQTPMFNTTLTNLAVGSNQIYINMESTLSCASVRTVNSNVITVTVNSSPTVPTISGIQTAIGCPANNPCCNEVSLTISNATGTFQWINSVTGLVSGATDASFNPKSISGIYFVANSLNGCTSTSAGFSYVACTTPSTIDSVSGVNASEEKNSITIYPNPAKDKLYVATASGIKKADLTIVIYDQNQRLVFKKGFYEGECKGGKAKECTCPGVSEFDINSLVAGFYFVTISDRNSTILSTKLIKE